MDVTEIDRLLNEFEERLERTRSLYEQYFSGIEKLEPLIPRKDLDRRIQVLRKEQIRNTALRFRFQTLVQRFNTLQQHWLRITREIDNGTFKRDLQKAAARFGADAALQAAGGGRRMGKGLEAAVERAARGRRGTPNVEEDAEMLDDSEVEDIDAADLVEDDESPTPPPEHGHPAPTAHARPRVYEISEDETAAVDGYEWSGVQGAGTHGSEVHAGAPVAWPGAHASDPAGYATAASAWSGYAEPAAPDFTVPAPPTVGVPTMGEAPGSDLSRSVAARAASLGGFRIPTGTKAVAPVASPTSAGNDAPKRASGGLRLGGGARRADPNALNRIASALDGGEGYEAGGRQPSSQDAGALTAEAPPARRAPLLSSPLGFDDLPPVTVAHVPRGRSEEPTAEVSPANTASAKRPLLSAPLDVDVAPVAPRETRESPERLEPVRAASAAVAVEPPPRPASEPQLNSTKSPSNRDVAAEASSAPARVEPARPDSVADRHTAPTVANPAARPIGARPGLRPPGASPTVGLRPPTANASATPSPSAATPSPSAATPSPSAATPSPSASTPNPPGAGDDAKLRAIYQQYIKSRREQNEPVAGITYDKLADSLRSQAQKLKDKHSANRVDYEVVVKDGKTLIKPIVR